MTKKIKAGFLPLYLELYDREDPALREPLAACFHKIANGLEKQGLTVKCAPVCRIAPEFQKAVSELTAQGIEVLITMHLAYSPSLEAIDALEQAGVPVVLLDTTPCYDLVGSMNQKDQIMENHGIHGVQDLCSLLSRGGVPYQVVAGHWEEAQVLERTAAACRAAAAASRLRRARVGIVGEPFAGMGDFLRSPQELREELGVTVIPFAPEEARQREDGVSRQRVEDALAWDRSHYDVRVENQESYRSAVSCGLMLQDWAEEEALDALTVNFLSTGPGKLSKMPFSSLSKMMAEGIGYAGEGDCLTAALSGALAQTYPDSSFSEMFCPCWKNGVLLLSHMGEMNLNLAARTPVLADQPFSYTEAGDTVKASACFRAGRGVVVNLCLGTAGYRLILAQVSMLDLKDDDSVYNRTIRGWMKPDLPLAEFLEAYSRAGGTHHWVLVYDTPIEELTAFGRFAGFQVEVIE